MMVTAATAPSISLTKNKLLMKTASRYRSENSVMCGYLYATTALMTMYFEGPRPSWMRDVKFDKLSASTKETVEMVKQVFGLDEIYPANPNLVLSTDDTTLFLFEGTSVEGGDEEWDWKLIDSGNSSSGVRSDFEVRDDAENSGGLCVRLTFTFTASGMSAPPYVSVSGLTNDELSADACPNGILAAKVPGLCIGGSRSNPSSF